MISDFKRVNNSESALDSVANAQAAHAPAIFLVDELDTTVPPKYQQLVIQAYARKKQTVIGGTGLNGKS